MAFPGPMRPSETFRVSREGKMDGRTFGGMDACMDARTYGLMDGKYPHVLRDSETVKKDNEVSGEVRKGF